jgi:hypothetical protein
VREAVVSLQWFSHHVSPFLRGRLFLGLVSIDTWRGHLFQPEGAGVDSNCDEDQHPRRSYPTGRALASPLLRAPVLNLTSLQAAKTQGLLLDRMRAITPSEMFARPLARDVPRVPPPSIPGESRLGD